MSNGNGTTTAPDDQVIAATQSNGAPINAETSLRNPMAKFGLAMVPFTPVAFTGTDALYAWGRLVVYGGLALGIYRKNKTLSTVFGVAAGVSVLTSLGGTSWNGNGGQ